MDTKPAQPESPTEAISDSDKGAKDPRNVSTIAFPYNDLDDALTVARAIHEKVGGVSSSPDLLAAAMGAPPTSGTFRLRVSAARIFGLVRTTPGKIEITDLGFEAMDAARQRGAKVRAFLNVPLYQRVYEDFKGKQLPPRPAAFELMLERLGVSPKQKDKARTALDRSATQAGFYDHGKDRLVMPNVDATSQTVLAQPEPKASEPMARQTSGNGGNGDGGGGGGDRHPFIQGLLDTLPAPHTTWTIEGRAKWLQAAANIFDLIYEGDGRIKVEFASPPPTGTRP